MPAITISDRLRIRSRHAALSRERDNEVARVIERLLLQRGSMKGRWEPGGFTPQINASLRSDPDYDFKAALVRDEKDKPALVFLVPGHVSGAVPFIVTADGKEVAMDDSTDEETYTLPALPVPDSAFAKHGRIEKALIFLRYELRPEDAGVEKVTVVAADKVPEAKAWTWHRLAGWVRRFSGEDTWVPMIFFSQQFDVSNVDKATGRFKAWPRIA